MQTLQIAPRFSRLPSPRAAHKRTASDPGAGVHEAVREGEWEPRPVNPGPGARRQSDAQANARFAALDYRSQRALLAYGVTQSHSASGQAEPAWVDVLI